MEEIKETGINGFLKWLQKAQPGLYKKIAPEIASKVPNAFSDFHQGNWKTAGLSNSQAVAKLNGLGDVFDMSSLAFDPSVLGSAPTVDVSDAANSGGSSSSLTDTIGGIVKGISTLYMTKQQADIQQQVVNTQLQRAALGLPPLPTSLSNLGVPQVSVGLTTGTGGALMIGGALLVGMVLFGMIGKRGR